MKKKTKCPACDGEFFPTIQQAVAGQANCPGCGAMVNLGQRDAGPNLLTAQAAFATSEPIELPEGDGADYDIQWMPPGPQAPNCFVNDKPRKLSFTCRAKHAELLNAQLQSLLRTAKAGNGDKPMTDYNHEDGAASSRPSKMYWGGDDPKTGGIRLVGKWIARARQAIRDGEWDRFSPEWQFDPKTEEPIGIKVNLGGLVNQAAFSKIARVVAKNGGAANLNEETTMTDKEIESAIVNGITAGLKPFETRIAALETATGKSATEQEAGTAKAAAAEITKIIDAALLPIKDQLKGFETAQKTTLTAQAKSAVGKYIGRAGLAPQDTKAVEFWEKAYLADPAGTEEMLAKLPVARASSVRITTTGNGNNTATASAVEPEDQFIAKAKKFADDNKITDQAQALVAYARTSEGAELYNQFREKVRTAGSHN